MLHGLSLVAVVIGATSVACSGPSRVGGQPSWRKSATAATDGSKDRAKPQVVVFAPSGLAAANYNQPGPPAPSDPLADSIVAALQQAAIAAGMEAPVADGRLFAAARELAAVVPEDSPMQYPAVEFALQRHGIIEPSPHLMVIWGPIDDPSAIMEQLTARIPEILQSGPFARIGVGSVSRGPNGEGAAILALQASHIETEPIPRSLPAGGSTTLRGRIQSPFENPELFVTRTDGSVEQTKLTLDSAGQFRASFHCAQHRGRQQVEITAVDITGSTVLANFPLWCGESPPQSIRIEVDTADLGIVSAAQAEKRMLELLDRDRAKHRMPPLTLDSAVSDVARAHSREMYETGVVAHISPRTGSAADRVRSVGIRTPVVLENVARTYGIAEAEVGLMNSPGHRANILSREVNRVGIGVVVGEEVAGRRELFVTQVFTSRIEKMDRSALRSALRKTMEGSSTLRWDRGLSDMAQLQAVDVASGMTNKEATRRTSARAKKSADGGNSLGNRFGRLSTAVVTVPSIRAFKAEAVLRDRSWTHYGIGVAQGAHPEFGDNAIYIVVLLAVTR